MAFFSKLNGTSVGSFLISLLGVRLKNNSGNLDVRNNGDTAFADVNAKNIGINDNGSGHKTTLQASGSQSGDILLVLPPDDGSAGQVLQTDGSGVLTWATTGATSDKVTVDTTSFAFGSSSTISMFTLPANAVVLSVSVVVDTAFDGTPSLTVGVNGGSASKYVGSSDVNLLVAGNYQTSEGWAPVGTTEALEISYTAGSATAGSGRVLVQYVTTPN